MKKRVLGYAVGAGATALIGFTGLAVAQTATTTSTTTGSFAQRLATKFGLKQADVESFMQEDRTAREAEMQQTYETKLSEAVKAGTITETQKTAILAKQAEMKANRDANKDNFKNMTEAERKSAMDAKKAEMDKWLADNGLTNVDKSLIMPGGGRGRGKGMGMGGPGGMMDGAAPTSTSTTTN